MLPYKMSWIPESIAMKKILSVSILFCYLFVGFGVPLESAACTHHGVEVAKKKKPPLQKKFRSRHLWSTVKHVITTKPITKPDENHLLPVTITAPDESSKELLDPLALYLISEKSPLFRELRAPPQL